MVQVYVHLVMGQENIPVKTVMVVANALHVKEVD